MSANNHRQTEETLQNKETKKCLGVTVLETIVRMDRKPLIHQHTH